MLSPKSGAKVGIKKTSLEFRDSFGIDGTILGFWGLKWDSNGNEMGLVSRAVIEPSEYIIAERNRHQFFQFVVHHTCIIVGIDVGLFLPFEQFLDEGSGLVVSTQYGLLQGLDDVRFFVFGFGFLGEDDGIGDVRQIVGRKGRIFGRGDIFCSVGYEGADEVGDGRSRHGDIIMVKIKVHRSGCVVIGAH